MNKIKTILKSKISFGIKFVPFLAVAILVGVTAVYAGNINPTGTPGKTMKTLSDLYQLIETGSNTPSVIFTTPISINPAGTMVSIGDTYDLLTDKIADIDGTQILTGTSIFGVPGSAIAETPAPTFASADTTSYQCEWLTTDPEQPAVTLQTICSFHSTDGCSWTGSACTGGIKTPLDGYMSWYAGKAACENSTAEGQTMGTWRLPTSLELYKHFLDDSISGNPPTGFTGDNYWSYTTNPSDIPNAFYVGMSNGNVGGGFLKRSLTVSLVHCAH